MTDQSDQFQRSFARAEYRRQSIFRSRAVPKEGWADERPFLLRPGYEEENLIPAIRGTGGATERFADRRIAWWRSDTWDDMTVWSVPTRNMLSSQVSCVNFLLPLASNPETLTRMLRAIDDDVVGVESIGSGEPGNYVEFERVGLEDALEPGPFTRGRRCTSIDAFLLARIPDGRRAYFLEWKYTETCGKDLGPGDNATRIARYSQLFDDSGLFTRPLPELLWEPMYQIVRSLLLGERSVRRGELGITEAKTVIVCPTGNDAYRILPAGHPLAPSGDIPLHELVGSSLTSGGRFHLTDQRTLYEAVTGSPADLGAWSAYHQQRYSWA